MKKMLVFKNGNKIVGYGEEESVDQDINSGRSAIFTVRSFVGGNGEAVEVDAKIHDQLSNPDDDLTVDDLVLKGGQPQLSSKRTKLEKDRAVSSEQAGSQAP